MARIIHRDTVIAHHLVMMGYGQWLGNDPRGSGSTGLRAEKFEDLGDVHHGRKIVQPTRQELRAFYRSSVWSMKYCGSIAKCVRSSRMHSDRS